MTDSPPYMFRLFALIISTFCFALPVSSQPVTVFAAASLREAMSEIAFQYSSDVTLSFGGSGTLARQIASGAPADVIVLAHRDWAAWLKARDLLLNDSTREVAGGQLVLVGPSDSPAIEAPDTVALIAALDGGRLAMGHRDGVPAGAYAREWLQHIDAWDALAGHVAETDNVRAALVLVALRAAPLGLVYASDALAEPRVKILYSVPPDAHAPIRYPAAALTEEGRGFVHYLASLEASAIFGKHGFRP